jgi:uncharacterized protein (TIGR02246 family)
MRLAGSITGAIAALMVSTVFCGIVDAAAAKSDTRAQIRALEDRYVAAVNARDVDKIMECYAPGDSLFVFDVIPPREYAGADAYHKNWSDLFAGLKGPVKVELSDLGVTGSGNLAFGHVVQHFTATGSDGKPVDFTFRTTDVYRKIKGQWLIVQEHNSVPVDVATGKADIQSKP